MRLSGMQNPPPDYITALEVELEFLRAESIDRRRREADIHDAYWRWVFENLQDVFRAGSTLDARRLVCEILGTMIEIRQFGVRDGLVRDGHPVALACSISRPFHFLLCGKA